MSVEMILGDVCSKIGSGATPRGGKRSYLETGPFSLIRSQNVHNHGFEKAGLAFISEDQAARLGGVAVLEGDVLLNITGDSVARVCQVAKDVLPARVNQHVAIIRPNSEKLDPRFLRYFMVQPVFQDHMLALASVGATRNALTKGMIEGFEIPAKPIREQREIAAVLGALDDKIEVNRKTAATLEEMARALYRSWFVDFDPVHAKAAGRAPAHMAPQIAALFPESFGEDGLPAGWECGAISDLGDVVTGKTPSTKKPENYGGFCPFIKIPDMHGNIYVVEPTSFLSKDGAASQKNQMLPIGSVSVSCIATPGLVTINHRPSQTNQQINSVKPFPEYSTEFVYWTCVQASEDVLMGGSGGSVFHNMNKSTFSAIPVILGAKDARAAFTESVRPWHKKILEVAKENQTLATLRDTLLPRLMSGELRVGEAKEHVEAVA